MEAAALAEQPLLLPFTRFTTTHHLRPLLRFLHQRPRRLSCLVTWFCLLRIPSYRQAQFPTTTLHGSQHQACVSSSLRTFAAILEHHIIIQAHSKSHNRSAYLAFSNRRKLVDGTVLRHLLQHV